MGPFSQRFVEALRKRLPELVSSFQESSDHDIVSLHLKAPSGHGELYVELPASSEAESDEEVSVSFGPWHGHYSQFDYWLAEEPFARVVDLIADILRDVVVIRVTTKGGTKISCQPLHLWWSGSNPTADVGADHFYWISWTGQNDLLPPQPITERLSSKAARPSTGCGARRLASCAADVVASLEARIRAIIQALRGVRFKV